MKTMNDRTQDTWILDAIVDEAMHMGALCQFQIETHTGKPGTFCIVTRNGNAITGFWPDEPAQLKIALAEDAEIAAILGFSDGKYIARLQATTRDNALSLAAVRKLSARVAFEANTRIAAQPRTSTSGLGNNDFFSA